MKSTNFTASCVCGGISLEHEGEIISSNYCHCSDCRKTNGSAFNISVKVERRNLKENFEVELKCYTKPSSRNQAERYFCSFCGSPIYTLHPSSPDFAWIKAGIIDQPEVVQPSYENWTSDKVAWSCINVPESHSEGRSSKVSPTEG